jgi:hypothetical protein
MSSLLHSLRECLSPRSYSRLKEDIRQDPVDIPETPTSPPILMSERVSLRLPFGATQVDTVSLSLVLRKEEDEEDYTRAEDFCYGREVEKDYWSGIGKYAEMANAGNFSAALSMATYYCSRCEGDEDIRDGATIYLSLARQGVGEAKIALANLLLENKHGLRVFPEKAPDISIEEHFHYLVCAARANQTKVNIILGLIYYFEGLRQHKKRNSEPLAELYKKAKEQFRLAFDSPTDESQKGVAAYFLYKLTSRVVCFIGSKRAEEKSKSLEWLNIALEKGEALAYIEKGKQALSLASSSRYSKNLEKARQLFSAAHKAGSVEAYYFLSICARRQKKKNEISLLRCWKEKTPQLYYERAYFYPKCWPLKTLEVFSLEPFEYLHGRSIMEDSTEPRTYTVVFQPQFRVIFSPNVVDPQQRKIEVLHDPSCVSHVLAGHHLMTDRTITHDKWLSSEKQKLSTNVYQLYDFFHSLMNKGYLSRYNFPQEIKSVITPFDPDNVLSDAEYIQYQENHRKVKNISNLINELMSIGVAEFQKRGEIENLSQVVSVLHHTTDMLFAMFSSISNILGSDTSYLMAILLKEYETAKEENRYVNWDAIKESVDNLFDILVEGKPFRLDLAHEKKENAAENLNLYEIDLASKQETHRINEENYARLLALEIRDDDIEAETNSAKISLEESSMILKHAREGLEIAKASSEQAELEYSHALKDAAPYQAHDSSWAVMESVFLLREASHHAHEVDAHVEVALSSIGAAEARISEAMAIIHAKETSLQMSPGGSKGKEKAIHTERGKELERLRLLLQEAEANVADARKELSAIRSAKDGAGSLLQEEATS